MKVYLNDIFKLSFVLFIITSILLATIFSFSSQNTAHAYNSSVFEAQHSCGGGSSSGSDDSDSSGSSNDDGDDVDSGDIGKEQKKTIKEAYKVFHDEYGFSGVFIAGILGNWWQETGGKLSPMASEGDTEFNESNAKAATDDANRGIGFGQWTFERHTALVDFAKDKGKDWWDAEVQFEFMMTKDSGKDTLKKLALDASDDLDDAVIKFHKEWEISADSDAEVLSGRGEPAKKIWKYMQDEGMDGKKDESKIKKISSGSSSSSASATDSSGDAEQVDPCDDGSESSGKTNIDGEMLDSVEANGGSGKVITKQYEWDEFPEKYKKHVSLPQFDTKYLKGSPYTANGRDKGQCTELTWAYLNQLWTGEALVGNGSADGNGNVIYKKYKAAGHKTTHNPTVGYGFSSDPPYAGAALPSVGHTGVVVGVMDDGKWIMANMNVGAKPAPSQVVYYAVVDGVPKDAGNDLIFFEGVGKPKLKTAKGKSKDKDD